MNRGRPWNKGRSYVIDREVYANKASWRKALVRLFGDRCMRCGWDQATCDAHHLTAQANGGGLTLANGMLLCPNCHRLVTIGRIPVEELRRIRATVRPISSVISGNSAAELQRAYRRRRTQLEDRLGLALSKVGPSLLVTRPPLRHARVLRLAQQEVA